VIDRTQQTATQEPPLRTQTRAQHEESTERAIEAESPEGRPAHPGLSPNQIMLLMALSAAAMIAAGALVAIFLNIIAGVATGVISLALLLGNPDRKSVV